MPTALVVDDSPIDRHIIDRLLERQAGLDWIVDFAENGVLALAKLRDFLPDVVVTDLQMPEMDGLELVSEIGVNYPQLPVILITGKGSEAIAIAALDKGAASYIPKDRLAESLMDTIEQVLAATHSEEGRRIADCISGVRVQFEIDNDASLIRPVVDYIQELLADVDFSDHAERLHAAIAVEEAIFNAIFHGNLELPTADVRQARSQEQSQEFRDDVERRRSEAPYRDRKVSIEAQLSPGEARFAIRDEGPGFSPEMIPKAGDPEMLERASGRGFVLMRNFMNEVAYNREHNEVMLVKVLSR